MLRMLLMLVLVCHEFVIATTTDRRVKLELITASGAINNNDNVLYIHSHFLLQKSVNKVRHEDADKTKHQFLLARHVAHRDV